MVMQPWQPRGALRCDLTVSRDGFRLQLAFEIHEGETVVLVGPSGAGKSTSLAVIAGLLQADEARINLGDEVWCDTSRRVDLPPHQRRAGFVDQDFALFPHLTVRGNVMYGLRARGAPRATSIDATESWLERLGLRGFAHRPIRTLSGGQRQRVALARALASGAGTLLLDEPFGALDVATRAGVRAELRSFLAEVRLPALVVTHDAVDALALADRIAVLESGRLTQMGFPQDLLSRPATRFIAELFGLNHVRAELAPGDGLRQARSGAIAFHVLAGGPPGPVSLSFPPSAVTLSTQRPHGSAQNTFSGRVLEIVPLADRLRVVLDCGVILAADVVREAALALEISPGHSLWASIKATAIQVYP
jgi:molybdate transport system ATP-binding protein